MRRALLTFMHRDGWHLSLLAEDAKTPIGRSVRVKDFEAMLRIVDKLRGNSDRVRTDVYNWGRGSEWVELSEEQCRFFGVI
jgi:hypothetical protein